MRILASSFVSLALLLPACTKHEPTEAPKAPAGAPAVVPAAGGATTEQVKLANEVIGNLEQLNATLATVKDEASAKAAAPKLEALGKTMQEMQKKMAAMPKPKEGSMDAALEKRLKDATDKMGQEMMRLAGDPKLAEAMKALAPAGK